MPPRRRASSSPADACSSSAFQRASRSAVRAGFPDSVGDGGAKVLVSQNGGSEPVWSRDGAELYYRGFDQLSTPLIAASVRTSPVFAVVSRTPLFDMSEYEAAVPHANYDVTPDGKFVLISQGRLSEMVLVQNWTDEIRRRSGAAAK